MWPIMEFLAWCIGASNAGTYPTRRHDGDPFPVGSVRDALKVEPLGYRTAPLYIKGDLMEYGTTFGFTSTAQNRHPCMKCGAQEV